MLRILRRIACGSCVAAMIAALSLAPAQAGFIDFETVPGSGPSDQLPIDTQFQSLYGVTFSLVGGGAPLLATPGDPRTAFGRGPIGGEIPDSPSPGQNLGSYFLTGDDLVDKFPRDIVMSFDTAVKSAKGVIIDVDKVEVWNIEAYNGLILLDTIVRDANSPNAGDGNVSPWAFNRLIPEITSIHFIYSEPGTPGNYANDVGWAIDNLGFSAVPEPGALTLLVSGALALIVPVWRRRRNPRGSGN